MMRHTEKEMMAYEKEFIRVFSKNNDVKKSARIALKAMDLSTRKVTDSVLTRMGEMRADGYSHDAIAKNFGVSATTVGRHLKRHGLDKIKGKRQPRPDFGVIRAKKEEKNDPFYMPKKNQKKINGFLYKKGAHDFIYMKSDNDWVRSTMDINTYMRQS